MNMVGYYEHTDYVSQDAHYEIKLFGIVEDTLFTVQERKYDLQQGIKKTRISIVGVQLWKNAIIN